MSLPDKPILFISHTKKRKICSRCHSTFDTAHCLICEQNDAFEESLEIDRRNILEDGNNHLANKSSIESNTEAEDQRDIQNTQLNRDQLRIQRLSYLSGNF